MNHEPNQRPDDDLLWTAYQYTADELPEPAARAFEAQLETDQQAREALSEAVSLADTVRAALGPDGVTAPVVMPASLVASAEAASDGVGPSSDRNVSYGWARSAGWVALGAAACLVLTMALRTKPTVDAPAPVAKQPAAERQVALADAQADQQLLAVLFPEGSHDSVVADSVAADGTGSSDASIGADVEFDEGSYEPMPEAIAPDWLIAAVFEDGTPGNE